MKEGIALFVSGHLVSSFFLLPLLGLYFSLGIKKVPVKLIIRLHKILIVLFVFLPLGLICMFQSSDWKTDYLERGNTTHQNLISKTTEIKFYKAMPNKTPIVNSTPERLLIIQDLIFYFVDLAVLFSLVGVFIFAVRYLLQIWCMGKIWQTSVVSTVNGNFNLIESPLIKTPFSAGYFRKNIFIPNDITPFEKEIIVRHELNHFKCYHHLWSLAEALLAYVFWFNPMVHFVRRRGAFIRELECDNLTVRQFDKFEYTRLLIKMAESIVSSGVNTRFSFLTQRWIRKSDLRKRVETLMSTKSMKNKTIIGVLITVTIIVTLGGTLYFKIFDDAATEKTFSKIKLEYKQRAPESTRVELEKVPQHFIDALLINEDLKFYEHGGVKITSVIRAAGVNFKSYLSGDTFYKQGGSSITQQLAKQIINDPQKTLKRKFEELKITRVLEKNFTKDEILEMYLNMIYFGNGAFGLKTASNTYFGHDYEQLTLLESTMLIPSLKAPSEYNMLKNPASAKERQKRLLERIASVGQN